MSGLDFYAARRERFFNEDTYRAFVAGRLGSIEFDRQLLAEQGATLESDDGRHIDWRWGIASSLLQLMIGRYSAGDPVSALAPDFGTVLTAIEATALPHAYRTESFYLDEIDAYAYAMWLLSLCKLLRLDPLLPRVIALFNVARDDNRGKDALFEALVAKLGGEPIDVKPAGTMLKMVKAHPLLLQAIEADEKKRPLLMAELLKKWYPSMKSCYWYNRHDKVPQNFFGYWAFEAGLVTYLWEIDDAGYRDLPFYPKDLVDYARSHPQVDVVALGDQASASVGRLRCEANHPCPEEGYWFTPAKADSRRHFKQGEIMPDLGSAWGSTIWQWDDQQTP